MKKIVESIIIGLIMNILFIFKLSYFVFPIEMSSFKNINCLLGTIIFVISFFIIYKQDIKISKIKKIFSLLIAYLLFTGEVFSKYGTYSILISNYLIFIIGFIKFVGYYILVKILYFYMDKLFLKKNNLRINSIKNIYLKKYLDYFDKYPFKTSFITIFIIYLFYLIAFYPGILSRDPHYQLIQYFNVPNKYIDYVKQVNSNVFMTTHHPVFHTYLLGFCLSLGRILLNDNFGIFIYVFIQTIIYISIFAYSIKYLKDNKINLIYRIVLLLIYILVPAYPFYSISLVKDVYYTVFVMLYVLFIHNLISNNKKMNIKDIVYFMVIQLLICLFRHNGILVVGITTIVLIIYKKNIRIKLLSSFLLFTSLYLSFNHILVPALGISKGSPREMLSVPFQQTARYVCNYKNEINKEDKKVIDKVLGYKSLKKRYRPECADPVKNLYNKNATRKDLEKYFKVWEKELTRHPVVYIESFINNTYGYYYPNKHNWYLYTDNYKQFYNNGVYKYKVNDLVIGKEILRGYGNLFPYIPLFGLLVNIGFNSLFLIFITAYFMKKDKYKYLIILLPLYLSFGICLLSPVNAYFRYAMPYIFVLPVITILLKKEVN